MQFEVKQKLSNKTFELGHGYLVAIYFTVFSPMFPTHYSKKYICILMSVNERCLKFANEAQTGG